MQGPMPHRPGMPLTGWDISPSADGEFLLQRCKRNQKIAGEIVRKESAAAVPCAFAHDSPGPPILRECRRGAPALAAGAVPS